MTQSKSGKVAIVTGGARGIGRGIVERFVADGATVMIGDIDDAAGKAAIQEIGGSVLSFPLDVTSEASWKALVEQTIAECGGVDILVNNAGIAGRSVPIWETTLDEWNLLMNIDLTGVFLGCKHVLPPMIERGYGRIINIASIAGKEGNPNAVPYSSAKSGVIGLTKAVAKEVATKGILVNAVAPAVVETEILQQVSAEHVAYMTSKIPMGRVGQVIEVAALVSWLASDEISFSTGAVYDISGGRATY